MTPRLLLTLCLLLCLAPPSTAAEKPLPLADPAKLGLDADLLARIDDAVADALENGQLPGAVVLIVHHGQIVFRKAYGNRCIQPVIAMTLDTLFDLASLTKPIATATSTFVLLERGKLHLHDPVGKHLPAFRRKETEGITLAHLLLHTSGLIADNALADYEAGRARARAHLFKLNPTAPPGSKFTYSDVGFMLLGEVVEAVSGMSLDAFAAKNVFAPLGMNETAFRPQGKLKERAAATEKRQGTWMLGEVHDPRAFLLGGVAGHAGLFSTAADLAVYAQMLLHKGAYQGRRILKPATVTLMTSAQPVPGGKTTQYLRAYGWDMHTAFSSNRGTHFPVGKSFGHTGFTGTSMWLDPDSQTAVLFLSNRVHPSGKGNVTKLRGQVATLAAAALPKKAAGDGGVLTGIDVLVRESFTPLKGAKVGLVTNHTGQDRLGRSTIDLFQQAKGLTLVALFSPEHGIRGAIDAKVPDTTDQKTGLPIYSLYGDRKKPTADTLKGIDTLVFDIQDAGCRFYTYISTLGLVLEAAAAHKIKVVVLDRPNPLGGIAVEGPLLDPGSETFVAYHNLPIRHGMTVGELALLFQKERKLEVAVNVIKMEGWRRTFLFDQAGLTWVSPSPNLRSLTAAMLYPGIGLLETTNLSVGRGTERPFEWIGAPWLDGRKLAAALAAEKLPGLRVVPLRLTPSASVFKDQPCDGVNFIVADWSRFEPVRTGLAVAATLRRLYPETWKMERYDVLLRHQATWQALQQGQDWRALEQTWSAGIATFRQRRQSFLLYEE